MSPAKAGGGGMALPFPKTRGFRRKQELVGQIVQAYRMKAHELFEEGLKAPGRLYEEMAGPLDEEGRKKHGSALSLAAAFVGVGTVTIGSEYDKEAERYEALRDSAKLYLIREGELKRVLNELPIDRSPKTIRVETVGF